QGGEVLDLVGGVLGQGRGQGAGLELADGEDVEQQHRGVGHGGAAGFADDGGVGDLLRVEGFLDGFHHVDGVFLQAVVAALLAAAPGAVVVHGEAAADVQVAEGRPLLHQVDVVAAGLADAGADVLDVGDLGTQVKVHQAQAVEHIGGLEQVHRLDQLLGVEAEEAPV